MWAFTRATCCAKEKKAMQLGELAPWARLVGALHEHPSGLRSMVDRPRTIETAIRPVVIALARPDERTLILSWIDLEGRRMDSTAWHLGRTTTSGRCMLSGGKIRRKELVYEPAVSCPRLPLDKVMILPNHIDQVLEDLALLDSGTSSKIDLQAF